MKSAHKLGAALAIFILLSVAAYFIVTSLQEAATPKPEAPDNAPASKNTTISQDKVVANSSLQVPEATVGQSTARHEASSDPSSGTELASSETPKLDITSTTTSSPTTTTTTTTPLPTTTTTTAAPSISTTASSDTPVTTEAPISSTSTTSAPTSEEAGSTASSPDAADFTRKIYQEATQSSQPIDLSTEEVNKWQEFKSKYAKSYPSREEEEKRQRIFIGNLRFINTFNRVSVALFKLDVNQFADLTRDETNSLFIGPKQNWTQTSAAAAPPSMRILPDNGAQSLESARAVDWRHLLADGGPTNQGSCLDSAIFAIVASLESTLNAAGGAKTKLSEQQIIDCVAYNASPQWPPVCSGQLSMVNILDLLQERRIKLATAQEYSHFKMAQQAGQAPPGQCVLPPPAMGPDTRPHLGAYVTVPRDNMDEALLNSSPLVVAIDASQPTFHFYKSGLYHELECSTDSYNYHALLVAQSPAATSEPDTAAYTIRASLGPNWGESGHMRLLKDQQKNRCLPQNLAIYPNIALD